MALAVFRSCAALAVIVAASGCEQILGIDEWDPHGSTSSEPVVDLDSPSSGAGGTSSTTSTGGSGGGAACVPSGEATACGDCVKNGDETDVDCGGPSCKPCTRGATCLAHEDCDNGACFEGRCH
jgi:hypothetical protein